jgi:hypothetical protein
MRMFVFGLSALLAATTASMADDASCAAFKWPVTREQALFAAAPAVQPGAALDVGAAVDLSLVPLEQVTFTIAPERAPAPGTFGATASLVIPPEGTIQISLSDEAWIDVIRDGHAVRSVDFSGVKTCPGIRKSVRFKLQPGLATIQFSGAKKTDIKVAVLAPE